jgi:hypothetical protein
MKNTRPSGSLLLPKDTTTRSGRGTARKLTAQEWAAAERQLERATIPEQLKLARTYLDNAQRHLDSVR